MRSLTCLILSLCACRQVEVLCDESDRCEPAPAVLDMSVQPMNWQKLTVPAGVPPLLAITGIAGSVNRVYVVGNGATVLESDGSAPFVTTAAAPAPAGNLTAIFATASTLWVADGSNNTVHRSTNGGAAWSNTMAAAFDSLLAIYGQNADDVIAVGRDFAEARYYDGGWTASRYLPALRKPMYAAWATGNNFYIAGDDGVVARSVDPGGAGMPWSDISPSGMSPDFRALWGTSDVNIFAVGESGVIARYDGTQWSAQNQGQDELTAIWGSSATDIWVVGDGAAVHHYDGTRWASRSNENLAGYDLTGVWGDGKGGIWVSATAGSDGAVFKY
jgi:hypothetical protein